ncbi:LANO_0F09142g1_1 [Lachancea nothofagi CBS 11611]|uniref:LANO_0F09142g1_1 n=1 Tax=Lachancea nothofagi CBS 11611 TaxID=1266666 RepID=A0A1G4K9V5_9SACH|nr:LANO_0F09142g1_1 [Lachancea nothofagi CBS 11611]
MAPLKDLLNHDESSGYLSSPPSEDERKYWARSSRSDSESCPSEASYSENDSNGGLVCDWESCGQKFPQPELMYHHLCNDHVGRKSQKNLQLNCHWGQCTAKTVKRDHITSHLRVHVPLKPFACSTCRKQFKRPQDLKKHLKVHLDDETVIKRRRGPKPNSKKVVKSDVNTAPKLPSITFEKFLADEMHHYKPYYTPQLGERLQVMMAPPPALVGSNNLDPRQTPFRSVPPAPQQLQSSFNLSPHSAPQDIRVAAGFFSTLSQDMNRRLPRLPQLNTVRSSTPVSPLTPASIPSRYPPVLQLPPIHAGGPYNNNNMQSCAYPSVPFVSSRIDSPARLPHLRPNDAFSMHQKNSGTAVQDDDTRDHIENLLAGLNLEGTEQEDFLDVLTKVNAIKDFLICTMLEDEYDTEEESVKCNAADLTSVDNSSSERLDAAKQLSKYPTVVV